MHGACRSLASPKTGPDTPTILTKLRPNTGLRAWGELLLILRQTDKPADSRPVEAHSSLTRAISLAQSAPPIRLYAREVRQLAAKAFNDEPRRKGASYATAYTQDVCLRSSRPVLIELANRLEALAVHWQTEGRAADARAAREAVVSLMTGVVSESPTPDSAMLASELMIAPLRGLGATGKAERLREFREQYRRVSLGDQTNILPHTGQAVLAREAHDRVMRSMTAVLVTLATWVILAGVAVFLMVAILAMQPPDVVPVLWQHPRRGSWEAALLACAPLLGLLVFIGLADIPWTWLVSYPTLKAGLLLPGLLFISIGIATWICVRLGSPFKPCPLPGKAAWAIAALCLPTLLVLVLFVPLNTEPWQPPALIQRMRLWGAIVGGVGIATAILWVIAGLVHRTRTGLPAGVWARANLATVASALLLTSIVLWPVLAINQYFDIQHERAFVQAAADPLADRVGSDWLNRYFLQPAESQPATTGSENP